MLKNKFRIEYCPNPAAPLAGLLCPTGFEERLLFFYNTAPITAEQKTAVLEWADRQPTSFIGFYPE